MSIFRKGPPKGATWALWPQCCKNTIYLSCKNTIYLFEHAWAPLKISKGPNSGGQKATTRRFQHIGPNNAVQPPRCTSCSDAQPPVAVVARLSIATQPMYDSCWPRCSATSETFGLLILSALRRYQRLAKRLPADDRHIAARQPDVR